jgi:hypothetical protein
VRVNLQIEPCRELQGPQHAEAVVTERGSIDDAQAPGLEVFAAAERVQDFVRQRVTRNRIDREVAPPGRVGDRQRRIAVHREALMTAPGLGLAPRQRHVETADLVHGEALADDVDAPEAVEQWPERRALESEHLHVEILRRAAEDLVAHTTADQKGASSALAHSRGDGRGQARLQRQRVRLVRSVRRHRRENVVAGG